MPDLTQTILRRGQMYSVEKGEFIIQEKSRRIVASLFPVPKGVLEDETGKSSYNFFPLHATEEEFVRLTQPLPGPDPNQLTFPYAEDCISPHVSPTTDLGEALGVFLRQLPAEQHQAICLFPGWIWGGVLFLHHGGSAAMELCQSNPNLVRLLFHGQRIGQAYIYGKSETHLLRQVLKRLHLPQKELLPLIDLPAESFWIKLLKKTTAEVISKVGHSRFQKACCAFEARNLLCHLPRLNKLVFQILEMPDYVGFLPVSCMLELFQADDPGENLFEHVTELMRAAATTDFKIPRPRTVEGLKESVQRLWEMERRELQEKLGKTPLPAPPFPGQLNIFPLDSVVKIVLEGREMRHCAHTLLEKVMEQTHYLYKMDWPERCTIALVKNGDQPWMLSQVRLSRNREPQKETLNAVHAWLSQAKIRKYSEIQNSNAQA